MPILLALILSLAVPASADEVRTEDEIAYARANIAYEAKLLAEFEATRWEEDLRKMTPARRHEIFLAAAHFDLGLKRTRPALRGWVHFHPQYRARALGIPLTTDAGFWSYYGCPYELLGEDPALYSRPYAEDPEGYFDKAVQARRRQVRELVALAYEKRYEMFDKLYGKDEKIVLPAMNTLMPYWDFENKPIPELNREPNVEDIVP